MKTASVRDLRNHFPRVAAWIEEGAAYAFTMREPLHVSALLAYEFRQSLRFQVWRQASHRDEGITLANAQTAFRQFEADLADKIAVVVTCNFMDVLHRAEELSKRH